MVDLDASTDLLQIAPGPVDSMLPQKVEERTFRLHKGLLANSTENKVICYLGQRKSDL